MTKLFRILLIAVFMGATIFGLLPTPAAAVQVSVLFCAEYALDYADDTSSIADDYFHGHSGTWYQDARGARIKVIDDNTGLTVQDVYTSATGSIGCSPVAVWLETTRTYTVQIRSENIIGGHSFSVETSTGSVYVSNALSGWTPVAGVKVVQTASAHDAWKIAAVAGWAFHRRNGGISDTWTFILDDCPSAPTAAGCAQANNTIYISTTGADYKYTTSHEIGHGMGIEVDENNLPDFSYGAGSDGCFTTPAHSSWETNTKEYNSAAAVEGLAEFYATIIFNDDGVGDVGFYDPGGLVDWDLDLSTVDSDIDVPTDAAPQTTGCAGTCPTDSDYLGDMCINGYQADNRGVAYDWVRFWWDVHTASSDLTFAEILTVWDEANPKNWNLDDVGTNSDEPANRLRDAADTLGFLTEWDAYDNVNGVHR